MFRFGAALHLGFLGLAAIVLGVIQMVHPFMGDSLLVRFVYPNGSTEALRAALSAELSNTCTAKLNH